tara:strand:+ start:1199 stop:1429 length:231 start_codon:yes stop_codon:yes gene_type:complete
MSEELYNVEGHKDLARDPKTGSIINVNNMDYNKYVVQRSAKNKRNENFDSMKNDLDSLKGEMNEIKSLLKELVNGK